MKKTFVFLVLTCLMLTIVHAQQDSGTKKAIEPKNKYVFAFVPSYAKNIYGISLGLWGTEVLCDKPFTQYSYGINIQVLGEGFMQIFYINRYPFKSIYKTNDFQGYLTQNDTSEKRVVHNGLIFSVFGTFSDQINGVSISPFMSFGKKVNGLSVNLFWNLYGVVNGLSVGLFNNSISAKGLQIGLINKTAILKGFQVGLWNKNSKRALPIINWCFGKH